MGMSSEAWQTAKAKIREMEQAVAGLKKLRAEATALPDSVVSDIDEAITAGEQRITAIKNTMVD